MQCTFFSDKHWNQLYPFTFPHQQGHLRWGAFTLAQLWKEIDLSASSLMEHANAQYVQQIVAHGAVNDRWVPDMAAWTALSKLKSGQSLTCGEVLLFQPLEPDGRMDSMEFSEAHLIARPTDFFIDCGKTLKSQASLIQTHWKTESWNAALHGTHTTVIGDTAQVFMAPGARVVASTLNTEDGPIFIGPNAEIQEGSHIRGPFLLDEKSVIKMGSRVYGPTAIGPHCRIGGEVSNSVLLGFSNKGHDGFLGNSVIGHWCNLGADSNTSNLKNNYSDVRLWDAASSSMQPTGLQFCGLIMGDHSKCAINTMFNTGTIVGNACVLVGHSFVPKHVPSFSWGGDEGWSEHQFERFVETATRVMERRQHAWKDEDTKRWLLEFQNSSFLRKELK